MGETTSTIGTWGLETFGKVRDPAAFIGRALEEMVELIEGSVTLPAFHKHSLDIMTLLSRHLKDEARINMNSDFVVPEATDVRIFLEHLVWAFRRDGQEEVDKKMAINRERTWNIDPKSGTAQHV